MMHSLGNYEILETISEKGHSAVYLAIHKKLGRKTLLKVYSGADVNLIERFEREAKVVADLDDDSIVSIYDFGEIEGKYYISMEYVEGMNLREYLDRHELTDEQIIEFAYRIARSVAVLHKKGYIHRDLKPENILVANNGKIKLTDFGIALKESLNRLTIEGGVVGTPLYMSPEQINNLPLTTSSDVFALGIIYYQMATGVHPFEAPQFGEILSNILSRRPKKISHLRPSLPQWFSELVEKLLQKKVEERFANAMEVVAAIEAHYRPQSVTNGENQYTSPTSKRKRRYHYLPLFLIIVVGIVFASQYFIDFNEIVKKKPGKENRTDSLLVKTPILSDTLTPQQNPTTATTNTKPVVDSLTLAKADNRKPNERNEPTEKVVNQETTLLINTWPWCRIYLNYRPLDVTPMTSPVPVKPGKYLLSLQNPQYPSWSDSIEVLPNRQNVFNFYLDSIFYKLDLQVIPWGDVYIDGKYVGTTPLSQPIYLSRENHVITIKNSFYPTWEETLVWNGKSRMKKSIVLK